MALVDSEGVSFGLGHCGFRLLCGRLQGTIPNRATAEIVQRQTTTGANNDRCLPTYVLVSGGGG